MSCWKRSLGMVNYLCQDDNESSGWLRMLHLYAGDGADASDPLKVVNKHGRVLLEVDVVSSRLWDMNLPGGVYRLLLWGAAAGK